MGCGAFTGEGSAIDAWHRIDVAAAALSVVVTVSVAQNHRMKSYMDILKERATVALANNLKPIFCCGETKDRRHR
jgi:triosephosphate isomerase